MWSVKTVDMWPVCGQYVVGMWLVCGQYRVSKGSWYIDGKGSRLNSRTYINFGELIQNKFQNLVPLGWQVLSDLEKIFDVTFLSEENGTTSQNILSTDSDCCAFAPKMFGKLLKDTISRNYKIMNKRLLSYAKVLLCRMYHCEVLQSIMVASVQGIMVQCSQANQDFSCGTSLNCCFACYTCCTAIIHWSP